MPLPAQQIVGYRDAARLAWWTRTMLGVYGFMAVVAALEELVTLQYYKALEAGLFTDDQLDTASVWSLVHSTVIGCGHVLIFLVTAVVYSIWFHRVAHNTRALGAVGMMASPGWLVAHYYIPIINIWKPCVSMGQVWRASIDPFNWRSLRVPPLRAAWWTAWLVTVHVSFVVNLLTEDAAELDELVLASKLWLGAHLLDLPATILLAIIVGEVTRAQQELVDERATLPEQPTLDGLNAPPPPVD